MVSHEAGVGVFGLGKGPWLVLTADWGKKEERKKKAVSVEGGEGGWQATVWGDIPYCLNVFHVRENKYLASATYESVFAWITWFNIEYSAEQWKTLLRLNSPWTWIHTEE